MTIEISTMLQKFLVWQITALMLLAPLSAGAGESSPVPVSGFDDNSCGAWIQSEKHPATRDVYIHWFRGFVSGYNFGSETQQVPNTVMPSKATLTLYIDKHCRENPLVPFISAAFALVKEQRVKVRQ